jgi:hypothetical protein
MHGEEGKCVRCFGDETGMKEPLGRLRLRWEVNTKMGLNGKTLGGRGL